MIWCEQSICHVRMLQQSCGEASHQHLVPTGQARKCVTFKANPAVSAKDSEIASCVTSNSINNSLARVIHSNWPWIVWKIYFIFDYVYVDWDYSTMVGCKGSTKNVSVSVYVCVCDLRCLWNLELWDSPRFGVRDCCELSDVGVETRAAWTPNLEWVYTGLGHRSLE